ncbi:HIT domain-containing protein [Candidatus Blochmannia ocreatus (nom. nud.)]|uniref:HIT domain-containing protein n=1 Tax=Candidatus Blochmannia ocreatus (nom. nud.) TaxID=251538 RepID=A0ABY4SXA9_9ENTR|nr:HIT domain-containing protein [Candidatus Blochmannia ocreatus]URJ24903.1 HIT domain-containing protein [Candidatus Blochmannia ocreatus]
MKKDNIFIDIITGKIKTDILYQDDLVTAFHDKNPKAPVHVLIVPNKLIPTVNDVTDQDEQMLGRLFTVAAKIAKFNNIHNSGYRLIINCNYHSGQEVYHIHMHLLGGQFLGPLLSII